MLNTKISKEILSALPQLPGVYKYFDQTDKLIYVGKAKNLKNRVNSYFQKSANLNTKTRQLVKQIARLEYVLVNSEFDALLLENSLIKENQPKYNIMLRDDKTYPYICVSNDRFPKIYSTRKLDRAKGRYFGPYSSVRAMNTLLEVLHKTFKLRTCSLSLTANNIKENKFSVCLEYHIGNCLGPCEGLQEEEDYLDKIRKAELILKGEGQKVTTLLREEMLGYSENLEFEKAHAIKLQLDALESFQSKSIVSNPKLMELDVFTITTDEHTAYVNFMKVMNGSITVSKNFSLKKKLDESDDEILTFAILATRLDINSKAKEVLTNKSFEDNVFSDDFIVNEPKIGDKRKLVELSLKNALNYKKEKAPPKEKKLASDRILKSLQDDLHLKDVPYHIECFDNSNIQGTNPVASMVCFKHAKPSKKDYRHFKIKTVVGPDDFGSMKEIVGRRYGRLLRENKPLPNLIVIDGGKGQLSAACEALDELGIYGKIPILGIAKRLEELYFPGDKDPLMLSKKSESLKLLQQLRNEAHRFAITFHRDKRSGNFIVSEMEAIPGIGPGTIEKLLKHFRTKKRIFEAPREEIEQLIGKAKTEILLNAKKE